MELEQAKALFFAQYLGQPVLRLKSRPKETFEVLMFDCGERNSTAYLQLRSINQLTDEEKLALSCLYYDDNLNTIDIDFPIGSKIREERVNDAIAHYLYDMDRNNNIYTSSDYLKCIGVLLRFTYIDENNKPVTLQHDELIALGWTRTSPDKN